MSDSSWPLASSFTVETYDILEVANKAARAYACKNGSAIAVKRSAK